MEKILLNLPAGTLRSLDAAKGALSYPSRTAVIREAIDDYLRKHLHEIVNSASRPSVKDLLPGR